jgi:D-alanine-D-alanine ligase
MVKKRVSVLYEIWWPKASPDPPRTPLGKRPDDGPCDPEPDVHQEVYDALGRIGYAPQYAILEGDARSLAKLAGARTSLIFNLTESYAGDDTKDLHVAAFLELLGKPFTGCDARSLHLGQDKALAKKILRYHGVPTPDFYTVARESKRFENTLPFPLIVKPSREDGSIGIDSGSVVHDDKALRERVHYIHATFAGPALVERYVEGREIYVAVFGNHPPEALPLVELDLSRVPDHVPRIAGTEVKWWKGAEIYRKTPPIYPKNVSRELTKKAQTIAVAAYRALGLRDYGRVDLRVTGGGDVFVIEVNPNPWLSSDCEFFMAWRKTGRTYDELVARLVELAFERSSNGS